MPLVAGNWKMHKTAGQARQAARELVGALAAGVERGHAAARGGEILLVPPYTALWAVGEELAARPAPIPELAARQRIDHPEGPDAAAVAPAATVAGVAVGLAAQDLHWAEQGAYTGEVSAAMLLDAGCRAALIGHSERRAMFGETDADVARKVAAALRAGLAPILCVGETAAERTAGTATAVLTRQVAGAIELIVDRPASDLAALVIAYEPVWAIGTGAAAGADDAAAAAELIRSLLPPAVAPLVRVLYGGSVKAANVAEFMSHPAVDGVLVGGASLDGAEFGRLALAGIAARPR
jgi:triosephosphate isomerase